MADILPDKIGACDVLKCVPMDRHTTFRVGGVADYYAEPGSVEDIRALSEYADHAGLPYCVIGNGSNLIVRDEGYRGLIICLGNNFSDVVINECGIVHAQAGALLSRVGALAADNGLAGFEFASGIPGSVGGAVFMNAGAYGGEMKDIITEVEVLTADGDVTRIAAGEMGFGYRTSLVEDMGYIVLGASFKLNAGERDAIRTKMQTFAQSRREKQPLEFPSAGSTFKRPEGHFAAKLIDDANLKGFRVGGAQVSEKHAGFVVNVGKATATDIIELTEIVKQRVYEASNVRLELEVRIIG